MVDCLIWCIEVGVKDNILKVLPWFTALEYQHNVIGLTILAILQIKKIKIKLVESNDKKP